MSVEAFRFPFQVVHRLAQRHQYSFEEMARMAGKTSAAFAGNHVGAHIQRAKRVEKIRFQNADRLVDYYDQ